MERLNELYSYREMILSMVRKDLKGRYKGSVLGFLWTFINPFMQLVIYTIVFSTFLKSGIEKYYLFLFVALIPWIFFSSALTGGAGSIIGQKDMVKKIYFPREVIPIAYVSSCFMNMLYSFIIVLIVVLFSGQGINFAAVFCLPIVMGIEYIMAIGIALFSSAITVYFRDVEHILGIVSQAWMYLTPIMYPATIIEGKYAILFKINPISAVILAYRDILYYGRVPDMGSLGYSFFCGIFILILGEIIFRKLQRRFAEEL